jgi:NAD(P)H-hydrate epimerase
MMARFPKRSPEAHKGAFGHVLVIAGSSGYTGAAYLTSQAAMLSGSGLVTLACGKSLYQIMSTKLNEVMVRPFFETKDFSLSLLAEKEILIFSQKCDVVVIGPGISQNRETQQLVRSLCGKMDKPIVLDADGINAFAGNLEALKKISVPTVLTPHPGEMARLLGKDIKDVQNRRKETAAEFAKEFNKVVALKGHNTVVTAPTGEVYINDTGNAGMASAGVGDVLAGMIGSFIGQKVDPYPAAVLGVYFHGLAGDMAAREKGLLSLLASDILSKLPEALKRLV